MAWDQRPRDPEQQDGFDAIGRLVLRRRVWLGWSQRYLESQSGVDQTTLSRIENGKQYGLRWSRFATLVGSMGGLDLPAGTAMPSDHSARRSDGAARSRDRSTRRRPGVINLETGVIDLGSSAKDADFDIYDPYDP